MILPVRYQSWHRSQRAAQAAYAAIPWAFTEPRAQMHTAQTAPYTCTRCKQQAQLGGLRVHVLARMGALL